MEKEQQAMKLHLATGVDLAECRDALEAYGDFEATKNHLLQERWKEIQQKMLYKDVIAALDVLKGQDPENAAALFVCSEGDHCIMVKHGNTEELIGTLASCYVSDEKFRAIIHMMLSKIMTAIVQ
jgi:DNA-binding transcriptional MerR regulator